MLLYYFKHPSTTESYTLSLHDALPISRDDHRRRGADDHHHRFPEEDLQHHDVRRDEAAARAVRSEEHTSELQSHVNLVCRLLLEKKNKILVRLSKTEETVTIV